MPKRRRKQAGRYKKQSGAQHPEASLPLLLFQAENGLWGVMDAEGNIEAEALYHRASQSAEEKAGQLQRLIHHYGTEVLLVGPRAVIFSATFAWTKHIAQQNRGYAENL